MVLIAVRLPDSSAAEKLSSDGRIAQNWSRSRSHCNYSLIRRMCALIGRVRLQYTCVRGPAPIAAGAHLPEVAGVADTQSYDDTDTVREPLYASG